MSGRYCVECGCDRQVRADYGVGFGSRWVEECAECGSTGPFAGENPHYGPGNPDFDRDVDRERAAS